MTLEGPWKDSVEYEQFIVRMRLKRIADRSEDFPNPGKDDILCDCKLCKEVWSKA